MGFEPMIRVLQTLALPLGHVARDKKRLPQMACLEPHAGSHLLLY